MNKIIDVNSTIIDIRKDSITRDLEFLYLIKNSIDNEDYYTVNVLIKDWIKDLENELKENK